MRRLIYSGQFRRDVKRAQKRGKNMDKLQTVIRLLLSGQPLPAKLKDHPLKGEWKPNRDIHIEFDWLLIYRIDGNALYLERTGAYADLFQ